MKTTAHRQINLYLPACVKGQRGGHGLNSFLYHITVSGWKHCSVCQSAQKDKAIWQVNHEELQTKGHPSDFNFPFSFKTNKIPCICQSIQTCFSEKKENTGQK